MCLKTVLDLFFRYFVGAYNLFSAHFALMLTLLAWSPETVPKIVKQLVKQFKDCLNNMNIAHILGNAPFDFSK